MKKMVEIPNDLSREANATPARDVSMLKDLVVEGLRMVLGKSKSDGHRLKFPLVPGNPKSTRLTAARAREVEAAEEFELAHHVRPRQR